jgi:hypothetical protein
MSNEERVAWVTVVAGGVGMLAFATVILVHALDGSPLGEQRYSIPMIMCLFVMAVPVWTTRWHLLRSDEETDTGPDERDREIARRADQAKFQVLLIACVIVLSMAFTGAEHFWIASFVFAGLGLSVLVGAGMQISGYRRGVQTW